MQAELADIRQEPGQHGHLQQRQVVFLHLHTICRHHETTPAIGDDLLGSVELALHPSTDRPWRMLMVDQRNHGASSALALHPPHSVEASAGDLADLVDTQLGGRVPDAMLGHSLGGKTVLEFLRRQAEQGRPLPKQASSHILAVPAFCRKTPLAGLPRSRVTQASLFHWSTAE